MLSDSLPSSHSGRTHEARPPDLAGSVSVRHAHHGVPVDIKMVLSRRAPDGRIWYFMICHGATMQATCASLCVDKS